MPRVLAPFQRRLKERTLFFQIRQNLGHLSRVRTLALFALLQVVSLALIAQTDANQPHIRQLGPNLWVAAIEQPPLARLAAPESMGRQRRENWCWAASIQMVLNLAGMRVTQEQVVSRIFGGELNAPASPQQVIAALSGWGLTINGKPAFPQPLVLRADGEMIDDLAHGWPLVLGMRNPDGGGHVGVITAVTYSAGPMGPVLQTVVFRDPWPANPSRNEISYQEFNARRTFVIRNRVAYPQGPW